MKKTKKIASFVLAAAMLLSVLVIAPPVEQVHADERQELQQALSDSEQKLKEYDKKIKELKGDINTALDKKLLLDQRNEVLKDQIKTVNKQIGNTGKEIEKFEQREKEQYELFCRQVRQEEERGTVSYWSVLFKATGFADLLSRIDFINEVMDYNQRVMDELRVVREQLEESKQRLVKQKATLNSKQKELEDQIDAADRLVQDLIATKEGQEKLHAAEQKEFDRVTEELEKFHQQNGDISAGVSDPGTKSVLAGLKWPSKARYITSPFGPRDTGIPGASTDHLGVDIGAAYGTAVYAAQSGKVIQAGWNGGYGYSVTISHGEGVTTLYGHMSSYSVRVGNQVDRGQVIGKCGSTGISSGPHIHYEVRINGKQIDPLPYLPGYIAYDW